MNNFNIVIWNVRGMHDPRKRTLIGNLLRTWKADVVCLSDSKLPFVDEASGRSVFGAKRVEVEGATCGCGFWRHSSRMERHTLGPH